MSKTEKVFPLNTFGGRIQHRRKEILKMSRPEFYDLIYPNENIATESKSRTVKNWESGKNEPDISNLKKICSALKCSCDYLLGLEECSNKTSQFIHDYTGLSEKSIEYLHHATTYLYGNEDLTVIDYLLHHSSFNLILIREIKACYNAYMQYMNGIQMLDQQEREINDLTNGDIVAEIKLIDSGKYKRTINRKKITEMKNLLDAKKFKIVTEFNKIIETFIKERYNEVPDTN